MATELRKKFEDYLILNRLAQRVHQAAGCRRMDAGGLRASRSEVDKFAAERKFRGFLETSAKKNLGCEELK